MKAILDEMLAALSRGERVVLSSILASSGSVPPCWQAVRACHPIPPRSSLFPPTRSPGRSSSGRASAPWR